MYISCHNSEVLFTVEKISYSVTFIQLSIAIRMKMLIREK